MLISFAVTAKLICVFVFAYAKSRFSHDEAHQRIKVSWCFRKVFFRFIGFHYTKMCKTIFLKKKYFQYWFYRTEVHVVTNWSSRLEKTRYHTDVTSKVWDHVKIDEASPFFLVNLCQHQNKKIVMSTIMKTMIISSLLCIFAKY